jgi:hypothetical protein
MNRHMFLFLLFAALLACFGADDDRHAARRYVRGECWTADASAERPLPIRRSVTLVRVCKHKSRSNKELLLTPSVDAMTQFS